VLFRGKGEGWKQYSPDVGFGGKQVNRRLVVVMAGGAAAAVAVIGGVTAAGMGGEDDEPLTGETYDRAVEAALAHTGGGEVIETEEEDDGSAAYGVEVRLDDDTVVEVELDSSFRVLGSETDDDDAAGEDDDDGGEDDD
jgi:hypothetical protein